MEFHYQALDKDKHIFEGKIDAADIQRARGSLLSQGYDVLLLDEVKGKKRFAKRTAGVGLVSLKEKMLFVKHLSLMIKAGLVLDEALDALYDQARGKMKGILFRLLEVVRKGNLLSDGLALFPYTFSEFFVNMVHVGEKSGTLEENLVNLSIKLKKDNELRSKVRSAMMYPAIVIVAVVTLGVGMSVFVLPKLLGFFLVLDIEIPLTTQIFIAIATFLESYWYIAIGAFVSLIVLIIVLNRLRPTKLIIHWTVYHLPIFHQFSQASNIANFCRSLQLLLKSGITIDESLVILSKAMNNVLYQRSILHVLESVKRGSTLSEGLRNYEKYYPALIVKMVHVGEISGSLTESFDYLAEFYEDELDSLSKNLSTLIEPLLLFVIGVVVAFVALAIISPIYEITGGIRG